MEVKFVLQMSCNLARFLSEDKKIKGKYDASDMTKAMSYSLRAFCTFPENKSIRWSLMWLLIPIHSDHLDPMMHSFIKRDDISQADTEPISSSLLNNRAIMLPTCQGLMYNNMWSLPCTSEILEQCPNNWLLCRNQISPHTGSEIRIDLSLLNLGGLILSDILQTRVFFSMKRACVCSSCFEPTPKKKRKTEREHIHQRAFFWMKVLNKVTRFWGQPKWIGRSPCMERAVEMLFSMIQASCLVLFTWFQWIMYLQWFMVRCAQPRSSTSTWIPAWIFHRKPTGKSKIAQFKEVIKTVYNQYLSSDGRRWGSSVSSSPRLAPQPTPCPPAPLIDSCSAPSNKAATWASCSHAGLNWHVSRIIKWIVLCQPVQSKFSWLKHGSVCWGAYL